MIREKGGLRHDVGHVIDLTPTILELTQSHRFETWNDQPVPIPAGLSFAPTLAQDGRTKHDFLWWFHEGNRAIRVGDWKLVSWGSEGPWELYNLDEDRSETENLIEQYPERAKDLAQQWSQKLDEFQRLAGQN